MVDAAILTCHWLGLRPTHPSQRYRLRLLLDLTVGAIVRKESMVLPPIRNMLAHLHSAANDMNMLDGQVVA